jgi:hypothetical protein
MADEVELISLTPQFVADLREMWRAFKHKGRPRGGSPGDPDGGPTAYVVLTPLLGIDPIVTETGTGSGIGGDTGTGYDVAYMPVSAECEVYKLVTVPPRNVKELVEAGFSITVYSLSRLGHEGSVFVTAHRDMYGTWWVAEPGWPFGEC